MTIEVRELRAATKRTQLMHEEPGTRRIGADPFSPGSVDQPNIPGVHRALAVLEPDSLREQSPERTRRVPEHWDSVTAARPSGRPFLPTAAATAHTGRRRALARGPRRSA